MAQRLLERIQYGTCRSVDDNDHVATAESVRGGLVALLTTQHGGNGACPEYGLPDLGDPLAFGPNSKDRIRDVIRESIRQYEPRLQIISLYYDPDTWLTYVLSGVLSSRAGRRPVTYSIEIRADRTIKVTRMV